MRNEKFHSERMDTATSFVSRTALISSEAAMHKSCHQWFEEMKKKSRTRRHWFENGPDNLTPEAQNCYLSKLNPFTHSYPF